MSDILDQLYKMYLECDSVSTDSRAEQRNSLFFALNGPNFKGSKFAGQALEKGAKYAVVEELDENCPADRCLVVKNSLQTLQDLARHHRQQLQIPVIGITGSNGKTTTKELINAVLSRKFNTLFTHGNLNNHIGVPLTLLRLKSEHEIAIIEMGANHQGEIALLSNIALPTHGLITNIGKAHLEGFGGIEGVAIGKTELYRHLQNHHGTVFLNTANEQLVQLAEGIDEKITYAQPGDFFQAELVETTPAVVYRSENGEEVSAQIMGSYNFENICAASCIGKYFGVDMHQINHAIAGYTPVNNRSQIIKVGTNTVLLDAYNANPTSMTAAIQQLSKTKADRKVLIAGDMFELGPESIEEHKQIGQLISECHLDEVLLCGKEMKYAAEVNDSFKHFETKGELIDYLQQHPIHNSHILIKGSRGMGLETLVDHLF